MELTYVMIKPDGVQRNLIGEIIRRFESKGLKLVAMKLMQLSSEQAELHYQEHREKSFFPELIAFITSGPVVAMVWEGRQAVEVVRRLVGSTDPAAADPGSIRGTFGLNKNRNVIHAADSSESSKREIPIYFQPCELVDYQKQDSLWVY